MADFSTIARPYAKAVFAIANDAGSLGAWSDALHGAAAVVTNPAARGVLARPAMSAQQRAEFVRSILADTPVAPVFAAAEGRNLLAVLAENGRLAALGEIATQFDKLKALAENRIKVTLVSASEVDAAQIEGISKALQRRFGRSVDLDVEIDRTLVGGAVVRADDRVIDGSVRSRLERLAGTLIG